MEFCLQKNNKDCRLIKLCGNTLCGFYVIFCTQLVNKHLFCIEDNAASSVSILYLNLISKKIKMFHIIFMYHKVKIVLCKKWIKNLQPFISCQMLQYSHLGHFSLVLPIEWCSSGLTSV